MLVVVAIFEIKTVPGVRCVVVVNDGLRVVETESLNRSFSVGSIDVRFVVVENRQRGSRAPG